MNLSEIKYDEIRNLSPKYEYIDRYTNKKGIKLYLIRTKNIYDTDFTDKKNILFTAFPKFYDSSLRTPPEFNFRVTVGTMYQLKWGLKKNYTDFLIHYGFYEFKKWLNEIEEFENQDGELILLQNEDNVTPTFINGKLDYPFDKRDELRLLEIAKSRILEAFYKGIKKEIISSEYLKEICFVPNKIYEFAFNELLKTNLIDLDSGFLTSEGLIKFRDDNIEKDESRTFSHTVFIAQAFNDTMENIYKNTFQNIIETERQSGRLGFRFDFLTRLLQ